METGTAEKLDAPKRHLNPVKLSAAAPPSPTDFRQMTKSTLLVVEGQPGTWPHVLTGTGVRAALIAGGLYATGTRNWKKLAISSLAASATVTVALLAGHAVLRKV